MPIVTLTADVHMALQEAVATTPREYVALLGGIGHDGQWLVQRLLPLPNRACEPDRFDVDPLAFAAAEHALRGHANCDWLGFVHSHPHGDATPSTTDHARLWRDCLQLIVIPTAPAGLRVRAYRFQGARCDELPLRIAAGVHA